MPKNNEAWIYLLEDINDNRYVGSTGELKLNDRLSTHKRDEKEHLFGIRNRNCSSMKLNLHNSVIIPLMKCENNKLIRKKHESHYINNVYPECVNTDRLIIDAKEYRKIYYQENREKKIKQASEWRNNNKEKVNAKRREHYQKNKERLCKQSKERYMRLKLKNKI